MIQIQHLTLTHSADLRDLVKNLTVTIQPGEKVAIIGEEGNGKSSLLHFMADPWAQSDYLTWSGKIQRSSDSQVLIPQQLPPHLEKLSLNDYFFLTEDDLDFATLYRLADQVHFDADLFTSQQAISSLSGGEKLKIQLLHELSKPHDILFLDEPSNDLDLETLAWLKDYVSSCPETVVYISHDEDFLEHTADTIIQLQQVKKRQEAQTIVEHLDYQAYRQERQDRIERQRQEAKTDKAKYDRTMEKYRRVKQNVEQTLRNTHDATAGRLVAKKMKAVLSQGKRYERQAQNMTQAPLEEDQIQLSFKEVTPLPASKYLLNLDHEALSIEGHTLAQSIQLSLKGQDKIGIIGPNGCGKSTLLRYLYQLLKDRYSLGYMPQFYQEVLPQNISPIAFLNQSGDKSEGDRIRSHLAHLTFSRDEMFHDIQDLSGGQKGKLLLLKLVLDAPQILILDEPTRNFSPTSHPQVRKLFKDYPGAILTVSHDIRYLKEVCHHLYQLTPKGLIKVAKEDL